jgi:hypothetical protein
MSRILQRPELAESMANQLLNPGVLDEGLRSGLFLSGLRRTGKTTFLKNDPVPAPEKAGVPFSVPFRLQPTFRLQRRARIAAT